MAIRTDATAAAELATHMHGAGERAVAEAQQILDDGGTQLRDEAQQLIRGQIRGVYLPHYPGTITDETRRTSTAVETEVGPESGQPQGGMGPGVEFGSARTGPRPHLIPAFERVAPQVQQRLADAAARSAL